jgi:subunit length determinant Wzz-like protein
VATTSASNKGFDPEAEQEVDFARYGRMLARRWWLVAVGVVAGAVIGYLVSLGGTKLYSATATIYLGQPYNPGGTNPVLTLQTNPSAVGQIANAQAIDEKVAAQCSTAKDKVTVESFRKGISVQKVASSAPAKGLAAQVTPLVTLTVQASKKKVAVCAANGLARASVAAIGTYPQAKIKNYKKRIAIDNEAIQQLNAGLANSGVDPTVKVNLQLNLKSYQQDLSTYQGLLPLAKLVESPKVTIPAAAHQVSAQSPRNTVLIAAIIGLILGVIGALLWDRLMPRLSSRNGS